jgi:hypothetical protein
LREHPSYLLADHTVKGGASIIAHETVAQAAIHRFAINAENKTHGRRSSNLPEWGQPLLDAARQAAQSQARDAAIDAPQARFADSLRALTQQQPLRARIEGRSAEAVIADLLDQADERDRAGAVAQYLVGAKLQIRFPGEVIPVRHFNQRDDDTRAADFQLRDTALEVALGTPDLKHIRQVERILDETKLEVWLLVRAHRLLAWRSELDRAVNAILRQRPVLTPVESFVGQNVTELGSFAQSGKSEQLRTLIDTYNARWVQPLGPATLRVEVR